ncbi:MAG: hypothetical protein E7401_03375 [Ruminococcaceae bacterium]|nr:hypothetical protein [Oscillospiraceae bacterium]
MTKEKLMQLYYLNREIMNDTEELVELKIKARKSEGTRKNSEKEKIIAEHEARLVEKVRRCKRLRDEINEFIDGIEDSFTRQIIYYRYAKCMSWRKVAYMTGGGNTENGVRMAAARFLKKCEKGK